MKVPFLIGFAVGFVIGGWIVAVVMAALTYSKLRDMEEKMIIKYRLLLVVFLVMFASSAWAEPFLTCDNYPTTVQQPEIFIVKIDGATGVSSPAKTNTDGTKTLWYDLSSVSNGAHTVVVQALNVWGTSVDSAPFAFTKQVPLTPQGLRLTR